MIRDKIADVRSRTAFSVLPLTRASIPREWQNASKPVKLMGKVEVTETEI